MAERNVALSRYPSADVVVCEGTLFACHLAWRLRKEGRDVVLAMSGTSPFFEAIDLMRPWAEEPLMGDVPEPFGRALRGVIREKRRGRAYFNMVGAATAVEDILLDAGVRLYYGARPAAVLGGDGAVGGVVLGGKFGLAVVEAGCVIDATPAATVARLAGVRFRPARRDRSVSYVLHSRRVRDIGRMPLGRMRAGSGTVSSRDRFLEFDLVLKKSRSGPLEYARTFGDIHGAVLEANAVLARRGVRLDTFRGANAYLAVPSEKIAATCRGIRASGVSGIFVAGPSSGVAGWEAPAAQKDFTWGFRTGLAEGYVQGAVSAAESAVRGTARTVVAGKRRLERGLSYRFGDPSYADPSAEPMAADIRLGGEAESSELVVTGGGTSGVPAAINAARAGVKTICLESFGEIGGANTVGGVSKLWFGRWPPAVDRHYRPVFERSDREKIHSALAMFDLARSAGVTVAFSTPVCGVARKGRNLAKVFVLTPHGMVAISARQFVDATGDGDLAAWAGAGYTYGSERDEITLWYSFGSFHHSQDEASRHFLTVADQRSMADLARAVIAGRKLAGVFGKGAFSQYYLIPRESRHIVGDATVTYLDLLRSRRWSDAVAVCESNIDIKGMASSDVALSGFVEHNYNGVHSCPVPYRALLPRGLDNVIVTGRAFSAVHDALAMARMQADMAALGMAAGEAAALARRAGGSFRRVRSKDLQARLVTRGVLLPADAAGGDGIGEPLSAERLAVTVKRLATGPMPLREQAGILAGGRRARRFLEPEAREENYYGVEIISRMLCLMGSRRGADCLLGRLKRAVGGAVLPGGDSGHHEAPDHGLAPAPTYWINALSHIGEKRLIPVLRAIAAKVRPDRKTSDMRFYYLHSLSYSAERLADRRCVPALKRALKYPAFRNLVLSRGGDQRRASDYVGERYAYLELCLGRALARCGDRAGLKILAKYTGDMRTFLARSAWRELKDLTGRDAGFDPERWGKMVSRRRCRPAPFRRKIN